jgi:hypothetical protein
MFSADDGSAIASNGFAIDGPDENLNGFRTVATPL